jgi:electron transfer flavoprotein beta subunit
VKIIVCAKQIQDPEIASALFKVDDAANAIVPIPGIAAVMSPFDEQALEAALRLKDKVAGATVTVISIGTAAARDVLKHGLSMGADEAILLTCPERFDADGYVTASLLSRAIRKLGAFDLILTGRQAADLDAGVVGCGLAELLDIPAITFAKDVQVSGGHVLVERVLDDGIEIVEADLPALVTVSNELGPPRKPTLRETMRASRKPLSTWPSAEIVQQPIEPRQELVRLYVRPRERRCEFLSGSSVAETAGSLVRKLREARLL